MAACRKSLRNASRNDRNKSIKTTREREKNRGKRKPIETPSTRDRYLRIVKGKTREKAKSVSTEKKCNMQLLSTDAKSQLIQRLKQLRDDDHRSSLKKDKKDYRILNRFELLNDTTNNRVDQLIAKRKTPDQDVRYFATVEESFDAIEEIHVSLGHAGIRRTHADLTKRYANIPRHAVLTFLQLCELCGQRRLNPRDKTQLRTRRLLKLKGRGLGQILTTIAGRTDTPSALLHGSQEVRVRFLDAIRGRSRETTTLPASREERRRNRNVHLLSAAVHDQLVERLDQLAKTNGDDVERVRSDYRILQRYDVVDAVGDLSAPGGCRRRLVARRKCSDENTRYFVTTDECYEAIASVHAGLSHAGINKTQAHLNLLYANIPRHAVTTFIELCDNCRQKKARKSEAATADNNRDVRDVVTDTLENGNVHSPHPASLKTNKEVDDTRMARHAKEVAAARVHSQLHDIRMELETKCRAAMKQFGQIVQRKSRLRAKCSVAERGNYNMHLLSPEAYDELTARVSELRHAPLSVKKDRKDYRILQRFDVLVVDGGSDSGGRAVTATAANRRLIVRRTPSNEEIRFFVTTDECFAAIHQAHITAEHAGIQKTISALNQRYANIPRHAVATFIRLCVDCKRVGQNPEPETPIAPDNSAQTSTSNENKKVADPHVDSHPTSTNNVHSPPEPGSRARLWLIDMRSQPDGQRCWILVYRDHATGFVMLRPLTDRGADHVARELVDIFCQLGAPLVLESDNRVEGDLEFVDEVLRQVAFQWPACHVVLDNRNFDDQSEVDYGRDVSELLAAWSVSEGGSSDWSRGLKFVQLQLNSESPIEGDKSAFELMYGTKPRLELVSLRSVIVKRPMFEGGLAVSRDRMTTEEVIEPRELCPDDVADDRHRMSQSVDDTPAIQHAMVPLQYWPMDTPAAVYVPVCEHQQQTRHYGWVES